MRTHSKRPGTHHVVVTSPTRETMQSEQGCIVPADPSNVFTSPRTLLTVANDSLLKWCSESLDPTALTEDDHLLPLVLRIPKITKEELEECVLWTFLNSEREILALSQLGQNSFYGFDKSGKSRSALGSIISIAEASPAIQPMICHFRNESIGKSRNQSNARMHRRN